MNQRIVILTLLVIGLYLAIGLIVGIVAAYDSAADDLSVARDCKTWEACRNQNQYLVASGLVIWPVLLLSNPLLTLGLVVLIIIAFSLGRRFVPASK